MAKIVNLLGCLFVSLAFAYGQANDGAERLAQEEILKKPGEVFYGRTGMEKVGPRVNV